jgi:hypothetical protein
MNNASTPFSLSRYFPKGTEYFYTYPAGQDSGFFNPLPPIVDEFAAARPIACPGPDVKIICFPATLSSFAWQVLHEELDVLPVRKDQILYLPEKITADIEGNDRNEMIKQALVSLCTPGKLVIAQPFTDRRLDPFYQMPSELTIWLNDKKNMGSYIPKEFLPEKYAEFANGSDFAKNEKSFPLPCVVKVTSSCAGDGIRICTTQADLQKAKKDFLHIRITIIVEEFIKAEKNYGVQFAIPHDPQQPIDFICWHEQLTDAKGSFIGAYLDPAQPKDGFPAAARALIMDKILPSIRKKGWYGIGGFDVLVDKNGRFHFIDSNFRVTAMTVYDFLVRNNEIHQPLVSFVGYFTGSESDFRKRILPLATSKNPGKLIHLTALTKHDRVFKFHAALLSDHKKDIPKNVRYLLEQDIKSETLESLKNKSPIA